MSYKKGDRVRHPKLEEWGIGEVLNQVTGDKIRIFFVGVGEKTLSLKYVQPIKVEGAEAKHPLLDNLRVSKEKTGNWYKSLPMSIKAFLERYPDGFYGERYLTHERKYKVEAHDLAVELLNQEEFQSLLANQQYKEVCRRLLRVVNATNLIFPNEKMALKDGLEREGNKERISRTLYDLLYGDGELQTRFISFSETLEIIQAAKWTIASYFLLRHVSQRDTSLLSRLSHEMRLSFSAFEINYRPEINWRTYKSILDFSEYLKGELLDLKPRDMIDVQSFMWCIAQFD